MKVLGIEKVDYESRKTGRRITGRKVYYTEPVRDGRGSGMRADSVYVSSGVYDGPLALGDDINILYDRWGHCGGIQIVG